MFDKCACGRDNRYVHFVNGDEVYSCNKHIVCPTYDELEERIRELNKEIALLEQDKFKLMETITDLLLKRD